ncbi:MAG: hypothetical protein ACXWQO_14575 [Bdellovibrionota bacterium]
MKNKLMIAVALGFSMATAQASAKEPAFTSQQCKTRSISKGIYGERKGHPGEGKLEYCDNGTDQKIYLSGALDQEESGQRDLKVVKSLLSKIKTRKTGVFAVITNNSGGGDTEWFKLLMMGVEDACIGDCKIETEVRGRCESACNQMHFTCVANSSTVINAGAETCDHAETDDITCHGLDPNPPHGHNICGLKEQVAIYKDRCGKLLTKRNLQIDGAKKRQLFQYVDFQASKNVFGTETLTCRNLPWAKMEKVKEIAAGGAESDHLSAPAE